MTLLPGRVINCPVIAECLMHYECRVVYKTKVIARNLPKDILDTCYPRRDYHTLYLGEIVSTYADEDAEEKI